MYFWKDLLPGQSRSNPVHGFQKTNYLSLERRDHFLAIFFNVFCLTDELKEKWPILAKKEGHLFLAVLIISLFYLINELAENMP